MKDTLPIHNNNKLCFLKLWYMLCLPICEFMYYKGHIWQHSYSGESINNNFLDLAKTQNSAFLYSERF